MKTIHKWRKLPKIYFLMVFMFLQASNAAEVADPLSFEKENYGKLLDTKYVLLPHRGTYLLPIVHNSLNHEEVYRELKSGLNESSDLYKKDEAEFQVSFMFPIERHVFGWNFDLNFAYTHHAWWQIYNSDWSRPFRETSYMPELFLRHIDPGIYQFAGFDFMGADIGYVHQSNGQIQILSRGWDRIFARLYVQSHGFIFFISGWHRIPESSAKDDNPDIYKYMGYGEIEIQRSIGKHFVSYQSPLFADYYGGELKYSYPWNDRLRWFLSFQFGYGRSLIEYNRPVERYGVGIALDSLFNNAN